MWRYCNHRQRRASAEAQPHTTATIFRPFTNTYSATHADSGAYANAYSADLDAKHQFSPRATGTGAATATLIRISNDHLQSR